MKINELYQPGDNPITLTGALGSLEAMIMCPEETRPDYVAVLGHPHSLHGGTMQNKVVTTLARTFRDIGIPSLRFNFRGVGHSTGEYDAGRGESADMLAIVAQLQQLSPKFKICLAGFSFGAYVTYRAAATLHPQLLISIAPPVTHFDFVALGYVADPWIIAQGDQDEVISAAQVYQWYASFHPAPQLLQYADTGHFFHGKLAQLKADLTHLIKQSLVLS